MVLVDAEEAHMEQKLYAGIKSFRPKVVISYETSEYIIRTVENESDLLKSLELRHEVFIKDWQNRESPDGLDVDKYDFSADHLLIISKTSNKPVGTYRLLCSRFTNSFYSQKEFILNSFLEQSSIKLELGRVCIDPLYRDGKTIDILWRGLAIYSNTVQARFMFGCASINSIFPESISSLYKELRSRNLWKNKHAIKPTKDYVLEGFNMEDTQPLASEEYRKLMPPLLRSYLNAGALTYGMPALDKEFGCTDVFTVLDTSKIDDRFRQRYFEYN